jgi:hypothetical protein
MVEVRKEPTSWHEAGVVETGRSPYCILRPVPIQAVKMRPGFWKPRMEANRERGIPELLAGEEFSAEFKPHLLGGVTVIRGKGLYPAPGRDRGPLYRPLGSGDIAMEETDLTAIPYYAWANRGPSHMAVWIPKRS